MTDPTFGTTYEPIYDEFLVGSGPMPDEPVVRDPEPGYDPKTEPLPGSPGGVVEVVKRSVVTALRAAITGSSLSTHDGSRVHVDLEYPVAVEQYPGIWVQFSLTKLQQSGIGHEWVEDDGSVIRQWYQDGAVQLTIVALTSIERDRIADMLISYFAFSRPSADAPTMSPLYRELAENPYVSMTVNSDQLSPGGQSVTIGTPWDPDRLAYEDNYRFTLHGEFQSVLPPNGEPVRLRAVRVATKTQASTILPGQWI